MQSLVSLIYTVIQLYIYILIASAILSWLIAFNVVNMRNQVVATIAEALSVAIERTFSIAGRSIM